MTSRRAKHKGNRWSWSGEQQKSLLGLNRTFELRKTTPNRWNSGPNDDENLPSTFKKKKLKTIF